MFVVLVTHRYSAAGDSCCCDVGYGCDQHYLVQVCREVPHTLLVCNLRGDDYDDLENDHVVVYTVSYIYDHYFELVLEQLYPQYFQHLEELSHLER